MVEFVHGERARRGSNGTALRPAHARAGALLHVEVVAEGADSVRVDVDGEVDAASAPLLSAALDGQRAHVVTFDCRDVSFMGVAGVDELCALASRFDIRVLPSRSVSRLLALCEVDDALCVHDGAPLDGVVRPAGDRRSS